MDGDSGRTATWKEVPVWQEWREGGLFQANSTNRNPCSGRERAGLGSARGSPLGYGHCSAMLAPGACKAGSLDNPRVLEGKGHIERDSANLTRRGTWPRHNHSTLRRCPPSRHRCTPLHLSLHSGTRQRWPVRRPSLERVPCAPWMTLEKGTAYWQRPRVSLLLRLPFPAKPATKHNMDTPGGAGTVCGDPEQKS